MNLLKLVLLGCIGVFSIDAYGQCSKDYELFWADEFDSTAVDTDKWVVKDLGGGFGNQEIQYYQPENATVSEGLLHIKIAKEKVVDGSTTYDYTSAKLETASKVNFLYGKMEARIKMPNAIGSWPAFWMLGSNIGSVGWPHCGEIDVMEWVGRGPNAATGSIFFDGIWPNNHISTPYNIPSGQSFITEFHTFAIEWEPNEIRYYCDGNYYATYKNTTIAPKEWVFNHDFFLILNCAIGGTGGGNVIDFVSPQFMEVDYVRVYSLPTTADSLVLSGPKSLMENSDNVLYTTAYFPNTTYSWSLPNGATIVDGDGTNAIRVDFANESGQVKVEAENSCNTLSDSLPLSLLKDTCAIVYDNFEEIKNVSYEVTGDLTEQIENPSKDAINTSEYVAKYERSTKEAYDVLGINDIALENAKEYEKGSRVFFIDVFTTAPLGTPITLQLENGALSKGAYPQGRRSSYTGAVSKQGGWHTVMFKFKEVINTATLADQVDHIAILLDPGKKSGDVYYFDNLRRLKDSPECPALSVGINTSVEENFLAIYPNPVVNILYINSKNHLQQFSIHNALGEKVVQDSGVKIDVSELPAGIYLLKTEGTTVRFVKQ